MTQEQKAKAYDEALERARKIHSEIVNNEIIGFPGQITDIFPQLAESEDERMLKKIIEYLEMIKMGCVICTIDTSEEIAWLKSLRPSWKPSEEQMDALHTTVYLEEMQFYGGLKDKLRDLYEQLEKL